MLEARRKKITTLDHLAADRRSDERQKLILRIGVLELDDRPVFCLVRNISSSGVEVKPYSRVSQGSSISLRVGDENAIPGTVVWVRDDLVGIKFGQPLNPQALLRIGQKMAAHRRRNAPRVATDLQACLKTAGLRYSATVCDLSMVGARIRTNDPLSFGEITLIEVPGLPCLRVYVRWSDGTDHGVSFHTPLPMQVLADLVSRLRTH